MLAWVLNFLGCENFDMTTAGTADSSNNRPIQLWFSLTNNVVLFDLSATNRAFASKQLNSLQADLLASSITGDHKIGHYGHADDANNRSY